MPLPWTRSGRRVQRMRQVTEVLLRHGLGYLAAQAGLPINGRSMANAQATPATLPACLRAALEDLGPTYIKLGQVLSTRADILPPDWIVELTRLQDRVAPMPGEQARTAIESELGLPVESLFRSFDSAPFASASIGQVHRAELMTGEQVVIKVQRPGAAEQMEADLEVIQELARLSEGRTAWGKVYSFVALSEQFERELRAQLDYTLEGRHADRVCHALADDSDFLVPDVYWAFSTSRVLTMEYVEGDRLSDVISNHMSPEGRHRLANMLVRAMLRQAFRDGVYHADPHPGNLLLTPDGRLALMDFGLVGFLANGLRDSLANLAAGLVRRDSEEIALSIQDLGVLSRPIPQRPLRRDLDNLLYEYVDAPLGEIKFAGMVQHVLALAGKYGIQMPPDIGQFVRTLVILEGVAQQLEPNLSIVELAGPVVEELRQERYSPDRVASDLRHSAMLAAHQLDHLPARIRSFLQRLEGGQLPVVIEQGDFEHNLPQIGRLVNRVAVAIIDAGLLLLAGLLLGLRAGPEWAGLSAIGLIVLLSGLAITGWLVRAILRSGQF